MEEIIDTGIGKTVSLSADKEIRTFVEHTALQCPHFMGADKTHYNPSLDARTLLARAIEAVDYAPSTLAIHQTRRQSFARGF